MLTSKFLKDIMAEARPVIERQLDDAEIIAGLRDVFAAQGGDWGALKALIKSQVQDERDETGDGKRIRKLRDRSGNQLAYADMLGLGNMNEENSFADEEGFDPRTGEITEPQPQAASDLTVSHALNGQVATTSDIGITISNEAPMEVDGDSEEDATAPLSESVDILPGGALPVTLDGADQPPAASNPQADKPGEVAALISTAPLEFKPRKLLRPLCQKRDRCSASGPKECYSCLKAAAQAGAA